MCEYLLDITLTKKHFDKVTSEFVHPFYSLKAPGSDEFIIKVKSPSELFYTGIFSSFILDENQAWLLYKKLMTNQQFKDDTKNAKMILDPIADHKTTLEEQFKFFYKLNKDLELCEGKIKNI